jgi:abortive infection bacteriophage resistance protein
LLPFKEPHNSESHRKFKLNTHFNYIWKLYQFDTELKLLVTDAIEKIEVAFRASIINVTAVNFHPFWYIKSQYYRHSKTYTILLRNIQKIIKDKHEIFIEHYYNTYREPTYPPIWMIIETLSFGMCSKLFSNLKQVSHKKKIAAIFNRAPTILDSWLETLVYTRNLCAHHSRLWNRWFVAAPLIPKHELSHATLSRLNRKFIAIAYIINELLQEIVPNAHWKKHLFELFEKYDQYPGIEMGFESNWRTDFFWE